MIVIHYITKSKFIVITLVFRHSKFIIIHHFKQANKIILFYNFYLELSFDDCFTVLKDYNYYDVW